MKAAVAWTPLSIARVTSRLVSSLKLKSKKDQSFTCTVCTFPVLSLKKMARWIAMSLAFLFHQPDFLAALSCDTIIQAMKLE